MFEDGSYKSNNVHKDLYEALKKSLELDYSNQRLADQEEARKKRRKRCDAPRSPPGSPPSQPPPLPPPAGVSGALGTSGALRNDHTPAAADLRKDWWKPLPEEERPATPEPAWTIPSSHKSDVENNWVSVLAATYEPPVENSLLAKIGDMTTFLNSYCQRMNKTVLTQADFERQAYEVVKAFYPNLIHLQFQMEECHKMLIDQVEWANLEGDQVRINVNRLLPLGGPPGHVTIQTKLFFNKDLEYLRYGSKGSCPALSISKMKAASYPDFGLELLVPEQMWIEDVCTYDVTDHQEHKIVEKDFKNLYPSDFEDLNLLLLQGHLDHLSGSDKQMLSTAVKLWTRYEFKHDYTIIESPRAVIFSVNNNEQKITRFNKIYKFIDGTLIRILETLDYRVKEFKI
ncbi:hypothetical protein Tco_1264194 [Tanacetum coccineum]